MIHWQFAPPDPANRNSKIVDSATNTVSDPTLYQDFTIHVVHPTLVGHLQWQGRQALYGQPDPHNILPLTVTLIDSSNNSHSFSTATDAGGNFSVDVFGLPTGSYTVRVKGPQYLSTSATVNLTGAFSTSVEMGLQPAGDASNDNLVDVTDFAILLATFGSDSDPRADFNGDNLVDVTDFSLLAGNFGTVGNRPGKTASKQTGGSAVLELRPQGKAPANGGTVHVGDSFTLELWVNAQPGTKRGRPAELPQLHRKRAATGRLQHGRTGGRRHRFPDGQLDGAGHDAGERDLQRRADLLVQGHQGARGLAGLRLGHAHRDTRHGRVPRRHGDRPRHSARQGGAALAVQPGKPEHAQYQDRVG